MNGIDQCGLFGVASGLAHIGGGAAVSNEQGLLNVLPSEIADKLKNTPEQRTVVGTREGHTQ